MSSLADGPGTTINYSKCVMYCQLVVLIKYRAGMYYRDVSAGATGATEVAPKFSDTLTLSQLGGADLRF